MKSEFYQIDLHVHTPASKQCYKGKTNDEEYLNILNQAKLKNLKIIAITDHNTLQGYKKIIKIKNNLLSEKKNLGKITDSEQAKTRMKEINKTLLLFEGILILPVIEFEVRNGIHLLIIFNNKIEIEKIDKFIYDGGYDKDNEGLEKPSILSKWDIFDLYEETKKHECFIIDAHTDSNKGILNTIPKGNIRACCFKSEQLLAIAYKNEKQKDQLEYVLLTSKDYKRKNPIAFVKFSDAHNYEKVGSIVTWVKLDTISFTALKNAFHNPKEMVSVEEPSMLKILNELLENNNTFGVKDFSIQSITYSQKLLCSLNNTEGGNILFGVTKTKNKSGLPLTKINKTEKGIEIKNYIKLLKKIFDKIEGRFKFKLNFYELQNNKLIISLFIEKNDKVINIKNDGTIYKIVNREIKYMKAFEIENRIEYNTMQSIELKINKRIETLKDEIYLIKNYFLTYPIVKKFNNFSKLFSKIVNINIVKPIILNKDYIKVANSYREHGATRGNLVFIKDIIPPRLEYAYLRYSVPLINIKLRKLKTKRNETIYIVPKGGVFYSPREYDFFSEFNIKLLKIKTTDPTKYSNKFIVSFLKSTFCLWYCNILYDDIGLYFPEIFNKIRIPKIAKGDYLIISEIENIVDEILYTEKKFLVKSVNYSVDTLMKLTTEHNETVSKLAYRIDHLIYKIIKLNASEINLIENNIRKNKIYLPLVEKEEKYEVQ